MNIRKKIDALADDAFLEVGEIKIANKKTQYPTKTVSKGKIRNDEIALLEQSGAKVNEIFRRIPEDLITKSEEELYEDVISTDIRRKIHPIMMNFVFLEWTGELPPTRKEIELITAIQYYPSDFVIPPIINKVFPRVRKKDLGIFLNYVSNYYDISNQLNDKPKMGYLPIDTAQTAINTIIEKYYSWGIEGLFVDFDGKDPLNKYTSIGVLRHKLHNLYGDENPLLIYAVNAHLGKDTVSENIRRASDIFLYEMGFNILGDRHKQRVMPKAVIEKLKAKRGRRKYEWIFSDNDYAYHQTQVNQTKEKFYFNWRNFLREVNTISNVVKEQGGIIKHLESKKYAKKETIDTISSLKEQLKSKNHKLNSFFK